MSERLFLVVADQGLGNRSNPSPFLPSIRAIANVVRRSSTFTLAAIAIAFFGLTVSAQTYSGQATTARVTVTAVGQPVATLAVADTGELPNAGGNITLNSIGVDLDPVATVGSSGATSQGSGSMAQSTASINNVNIGVLSNVITADAVSASTQAVCPAENLSGGSVITGLRLNGVEVTASGAPNQTISISLLGEQVGTLVINEQIITPRSITVNALHLFVTDPVSLTTTDVVIASARSGINCGIAPASNLYSGRGTGLRFNQFDVAFGDLTTLVADTGALPTSGGSLSVASANPAVLEPTINSGTFASTSSGGLPGGNIDTSQSTSSVQDLGINLLAGAVTINATVLSSNTQCQCSLSAPACSANSVLTGLQVRVLGVVVPVNILGTPNQEVTISVPLTGSIKLTLNGRESAGPGDITAYPLRIETSLIGLVATDIVIASSHSDIVCGLPASAASASLTGQVTDPYGRGLSRVVVSVTDDDGFTAQAVTNTFGFYRFASLPVGRSYIVSAASRQYTFSPRFISLDSDLTGIDLSPDPPAAKGLQRER